MSRSWQTYTEGSCHHTLNFQQFSFLGRTRGYLPERLITILALEGWPGAGSTAPLVLRISLALFAIPSIAAHGRPKLLDTADSLTERIDGDVPVLEGTSENSSVVQESIEDEREAFRSTTGDKGTSLNFFCCLFFIVTFLEVIWVDIILATPH